jgi:hypothetical protein
MNASNLSLKPGSLVRCATSLILTLLAGTVASAQNPNSLSAVPSRTPDRVVIGAKTSPAMSANGKATFLRVYDQMRVSQRAAVWQSNRLRKVIRPSETICSIQSLAEHGEPAPNTGGGTLDPLAFFNPTTVNSLGRIAFNSLVDGVERNQGAFIANADGSLSAVVIGCGAGGGSGDTTSLCGDPSPIGGNFSGFFLGTVFTPDINEAGDVLFFSDVNGGSSRRGLFLYQAATGEIVKVAAIGDASPLGGTFAAVGPGSINNSGKVVFIASPSTTAFPANIFLWDNGVVTKVAAIGDPAPGGGTFSILGGESFGFVDGTNIPVGPIPDINDVDQICFKAIVTGGITERGLIVRTAGVDEWYVKVPDPTPAGGTYFDMQAASINNAGQIAFLADFQPTPDTFNTGWFAGAPGNWRKVIAFFDPVDGGQCLGLAFSRNPMQMIDPAGNVIFWTNLDSNGGSDRIVLGLSDGSLLVTARRGDPTPIGGTFGSMDAWPATGGNNGSINVSTPGAQNGVLSAHMTSTLCSTQTLALTGASSRIGPFEIDLPLSGERGIESRGGGIGRRYTLVFTFNNLITSVDSADTTCGTANRIAIKADAHRVLVGLSGVNCNEDYVTVTLNGVHDDQGHTLASVAAEVGFLLGDTNGDGVVDQADVEKTQADVGQQTGQDNFREDVNPNGSIDTRDVDRVSAKVGTMLPP